MEYTPISEFMIIVILSGYSAFSKSTLRKKFNHPLVEFGDDFIIAAVPITLLPSVIIFSGIPWYWFFVAYFSALAIPVAMPFLRRTPIKGEHASQYYGTIVALYSILSVVGALMYEIVHFFEKV